MRDITLFFGALWTLSNGALPIIPPSVGSNPIGLSELLSNRRETE
jgi:hypothetical protein